MYFINTTDLTSRWVFQTDGNANGMAIAADGTLYVDITGISSGRLNAKDPFKTRALLSFDTGNSSPPLQHERLFYNSISYYCDGVRVSKSGLVFCAARDGVEIIDPKEGLTLGRVRTGGGENAAVNIALDDHTLWIVGKGGVWKVSRIQELLSRDW